MFHEICYIIYVNTSSETHEIQGGEANEILAFLAADSEHQPTAGVPCHLPLAYASKEHHFAQTS